MNQLLATGLVVTAFESLLINVAIRVSAHPQMRGLPGLASEYAYLQDDRITLLIVKSGYYEPFNRRYLLNY